MASLSAVLCMYTAMWLQVSVPAGTGSAASSPQVQASVSIPWLAFAVSIISLLLSATAGYFQWRTHISKKPVVGITIDDLPPYEDPTDRTVIAIKNVGTAATTRELSITVTCSWMPLISYRLNLPTEKYCLDPNEDYWWELRLNEELVPNSTVRVTVWDSDRDHWERVAVFNTPVNLAAASAISQSVTKEAETSSPAAH